MPWVPTVCSTNPCTKGGAHDWVNKQDGNRGRSYTVCTKCLCQKTYLTGYMGGGRRKTVKKSRKTRRVKKTRSRR